MTRFMDREQQAVQAAKQSASGDLTSPEFIGTFLMGVEWADKNPVKSNTEVFIVVGDYTKMVPTNEGSATTVQGKHICAVYSDYDKADDFGKWLLEKGEYDGMRYVNYSIENFMIL